MHDDHDHDLGLRYDRRQILRLALAAGAVPLIGCGGGAGGECSTIPSETAGPYPGDGSNGPNALALSGIMRSDIRSSFNGAAGVADGVPLTITLTIANSNDASCAALAGAGVYLWHADALG